MCHQQVREPAPDLGQGQPAHGGVRAPCQVKEGAEEPEDACVLGDDQLADLADASVRGGRAGRDQPGVVAGGRD
jgi:hypothetical protein